MGCRGCGARRVNLAVSGNTFGQRPPQTQIGNSSKTFGRRMTFQGGRQYGKTIQTSAVNPNNMGQAPCCVGSGEPPPCPEPVFCCPVPNLLASQSDQQQSFTRESFPNLDGLSVFTTGAGSVEAKAGRAVLTGDGSATLLSQTPAEVSVLKTWCLCVVFDLMNYPAGPPSFVEIGIGSAPGVVAPKIVWLLSQDTMELLVVNAVNVQTASCLSPLAPGQHTIKMCYDEDTDTLTTKLNGVVICTESNFVASHGPFDVVLPVRFFQEFNATIKVRSYCLSRLKDFCEGTAAVELTVTPPADSAVIGVDVNNLGPQHPSVIFSRPVQVMSFTLTQLTGAGAGPVSATPNLGNVPGPGYVPVTLPIITSEINLDTTGVTTLGETYKLTVAWNDPCTGYQEFSWEFDGVSA